ncbi:siderophore ABC transporter substrate-binding protein [Saccharomonospora xinjiangensis]|uniref:ABC-type enterochelin transport system, periplasmic component n=1 Tax=Saccharomonospora xinjiangensis XJ-54 TaxID=882086 RepID=I0V426_9PSEU|nr:siderophore ABC transporter substrate-binding protein [Saccharomonospora xinjiangensis]EID54879.1 ABC-type enterochelin transport system, periplasmic component [Saccharomonospora xinjiangensis XJ-54]
MRGSHRRGALAALLAGLVGLLTACGGVDADTADGANGKGAVTIEHAQGSTSLDGTPERVVVFDLGVLETLDVLGVEGIVGVPEVPNLPKPLTKYGSDDYTKVGSLKEPDFEQVNALEPDLIIVAARSAPAYAELSEIAPTVDLSVDATNFLASASERIETLGTLFGKEDAVRERLDALAAKAEEITSSGASEKTGLVVLTTGGKLSAYGPGSRFGFVYDELGVKPAVDGLSDEAHGDAISSEFVAEANPDLIFVIDRDSAIGEAGQSARQVLDNALINGTTAAKEGGIVYLDAAQWYLTSNGLPSLESMVATVGDSVA